MLYSHKTLDINDHNAFDSKKERNADPSQDEKLQQTDHDFRKLFKSAKYLTECLHWLLMFWLHVCVTFSQKLTQPVLEPVLVVIFRCILVIVGMCQFRMCQSHAEI